MTFEIEISATQHLLRIVRESALGHKQPLQGSLTHRLLFEVYRPAAIPLGISASETYCRFEEIRHVADY